MADALEAGVAHNSRVCKHHIDYALASFRRAVWGHAAHTHGKQHVATRKNAFFKTVRNDASATPAAPSTSTRVGAGLRTLSNKPHMPAANNAQGSISKRMA